jgi:hypothetical protein
MVRDPRAPRRGSPRAAGRPCAATRRFRAGSPGTARASVRCAAAASSGLARRPHALVDAVERRLHPAQQRAAGGIEHDAAPAPIEQGEADLLFERADLLAHRAVREVQLARSGAQVLQLRDGSERGEEVERDAGH